MRNGFPGASRRTVLKGAFAGVAAALLPRGAHGEEVQAHGLSMFGDLKYPADFKHYDYVRPDAPKGGLFSQQLHRTIFNQGFNSFDTLHIFVLKGEGAAGMDSCFATLMARAFDEPDAVYGLAAQSVAVAPDRLTYRFRLRPGLTFHDGSPITAEDCAWSFNILKAKGHPYISQPMHSFIEAVAEAPDLVTVKLAPGRSRGLPLIVATLPIFSKAWWASRDFEASSLEEPLGSGPYKVKKVDAGRSISFERVKGWWGEALPSQVGTNNFDEIAFEYFRDRDISFQAFTAGTYLFREEFTSRIWATQYNFPALKDGRVKKEELPDRAPSGGQGWLFNTRRSKFADPRVRQALGMAFDFEWTNKNIMYGLFERGGSYFGNSTMMAVGALPPDERALLEPFRDKLSPLVFGEAVLPPVSDGSAADRRLLQAARALLAEAGWTITGGALRNAAGERFAIEFLDDDNGLEKHTAPLIQNLRRLGIDAIYRIVDTAQYQKRADDFDFDMLVRNVGFTSTPGEDLRNSFSAKSATAKGSYNLPGIADPVVDALIERVLAADTRKELEIACRALDRVLRAGFYWIPQWHNPVHWLAYWDRFEHLEVQPIYDRGAPSVWWAKG